jgi:nucleoside-diphosphate-sugar epimerase
MLLVTGGTGFLGRNFLEQTSEPCIFTGRDRTKGLEIAHLTGHCFLPIDLTQNELGEIADLGAVTGVVHCAALSSPWGSYENFYRMNVLATRFLLEFAVSRGIERFVHISTPSLYFDFQNRQMIRETFCPAKPVNHYARTKQMAEAEVFCFSQRLHTTVLRPRGIFGKHDTTIFPRLVALGDGAGIPLSRNGNAVVDVTHVDNVVHAIHQALRCHHDSGRVYNITNDQPMRVIDLIERLSYVLGREMKVRSVPGALIGGIARVMEVVGRITGNEPSLTGYTAALLRYDQTLDITEARIELNYHPVKKILDGLKDYAV